MSLAEKFQITVPYKEESVPPEDAWTSQDSVRHNCTEYVPEHGEKFNVLPPGMDITNSRNSPDDFTYSAMAGASDVSPGARDVDRINKGFVRPDMKGTDDQYSGEHVDLFYGEAVDEKGNVGFVERNNYLDRL